MRPRVFIIHGWDDSPHNGWFSWLQKRLTEHGVEVHAPAMPDAAHPDIETWVTFLKHLVGVPDAQTYFIGHSIGCQTILRYLQVLPNEVRVGGVVMVAGWVTLKPEAMEDEATEAVALPWLQRPLDWFKIRRHVSSVTAIMSDNDQFVPIEDGQVFVRELGAHLVVEHQQKHLGGFDGVTVLVSAQRALEEMMQPRSE